MSQQKVAIVSSYTTRLSVDLGTIEYNKCLALQRMLVARRKSGIIPDTLMFLDHSPGVYTIGRKADPANFPKLDPIRTERGGDITYHGDGQLVAYPIFDIRSSGKLDVRNFVHRIEAVAINAIKDLGKTAYVGEEPGIWVDEKKVASIGMAIDGYVSYHGIAFNHSPVVLDGFRKIRPCGLDPSSMGYLDVSRTDLLQALEGAFTNEFGPFTEIVPGFVIPDLP
ncbi:lipoate-protein ligase B [mine drainage metagenome]|uniref:lipoyl(octanoyl) transferase n=1 Tax=mine drainage metagenome TaxID=410659 RepID=T0Z474_9ZZZZ